MTPDTAHGDILLWAVCIAVGGTALVIICRIILRPTNEAGSGCCGHCGYCVKNLTSLNCPECGKDLREVGITRAYQLSKAYLILVVVALALLAIVTLSFLLDRVTWDL